MRLVGREQVHVAARSHAYRTVIAVDQRGCKAHVPARGQQQIAPGLQQAAAHRLITLADLQRAALARTGEVAAFAVHQRLAVDVTAGLQCQTSRRFDLRGGQVDVLASGQHHIASALHRAGSMCCPAAALVVALIEGGVAAFLQRNRANIQSAACGQLGKAVGAGVADLCGLQADVTASHHRQHAVATGVGHIQTSNPINAVGLVLVGATAPLCLHRGGHRDIARGLDRQRIGGRHGGTGNADVLVRRQPDVLAGNAATQMLDVDCIDGYQLAAGDVAGVDQAIAQFDIDIGAGQQCTLPVQIARAQAQVDLRHQRGGGAAIGQGDGLLDQPDDVAGQLCHLRFGQRHAGPQAPFAGDRGTGLQQRAVLRLVTGVAVEEAATGQLADLLTHQLLLVVPITQPLLHGIGRVAHLAQQVVRAQPGLVVGEARIGLDQIVAPVGIDVEQAGARRARIRRPHCDAVRRSATGRDHARPGRTGVAAHAADVAALLGAGGIGRL
ncbi:hypothetical protein LMG26824_01383 [Stenotrophomonas maltophilia]